MLYKAYRFLMNQIVRFFREKEFEKVEKTGGFYELSGEEYTEWMIKHYQEEREMLASMHKQWLVEQQREKEEMNALFEAESRTEEEGYNTREMGTCELCSKHKLLTMFNDMYYNTLLGLCDDCHTPSSKSA